MAMIIHHNTAKKAKRHGIELRVSVDEFEAVANGQVLASAPFANVALDKALAKLSNGKDKPSLASRVKSLVSGKPRKVEVEDEDEDEAEEEESEEGRSIVKRKYKQAYRPFKMKCGDELSELISAHVAYEDDAGETKVDEAKLKRFAQANEVWKSEYASLNVGMRRMNIRNRLSPRFKADHKAIKWVK